MMTRFILFFFMILLCVPGFAQEKTKQEKSKPKVTQKGEIILDDLYLQALVEKPSVSIVPKRIEPDLEEVEFIIRKFDKELKMVPKEIFDVQLEKRKVQKISDIERILKKKRN